MVTCSDCQSTFRAVEKGGKRGKLPRALQCQKSPAIPQNDFSVAI